MFIQIGKGNSPEKGDRVVSVNADTKKNRFNYGT